MSESGEEELAPELLAAAEEVTTAVEKLRRVVAGSGQSAVPYVEPARDCGSGLLGAGADRARGISPRFRAVHGLLERSLHTRQNS